MTKPRCPGSFEDAAMEVAGGLGVEACAEAVGRTGGAIRAWTDPDKDGRPTLQQAVALDALYAARHKGRTPFLLAYERRLRMLTRDADLQVGGVLPELLDVPTALGRLTALVHDALGPESALPGGFTAEEFRRAKIGIADLRRELDELDAALDASAPGGPADG